MKPTLKEYMTVKLTNHPLSSSRSKWRTSGGVIRIEPDSLPWKVTEQLLPVYTSNRKTSRLRKRTWLEEQTGLSRSAIYDRLDPKSPRYDSRFPQPVKTGPRAVAWFEHEVYEWMASLKTFRAAS